jgi:hypothetical protein
VRVTLRWILTGIVCEDGRWMELVQNRVLWTALILASLDLRFGSPVGKLVLL